MPTKITTVYDIAKHFLVNHVSQKVTFEEATKPFRKNGGFVQSEEATKLLSTIELLFDQKKKKEPVTHSYEFLLNNAIDYIEKNPSVFDTDIFPSLATENLYSIRRFLYSRGVKATYVSSSKTRCPLGQMLSKLFPFAKVAVLKEELIINDNAIALSKDLQQYTKAFDNRFPKGTNIPRNEAINFINDLIQSTYFSEDER